MASSSPEPPFLLLGLANELLDQIVGHVCSPNLEDGIENCERQRELLPTALTCRQLRPIAERHMYTAITTQNFASFNGYVDRYGTRLRKLCQTLSSRSDLALQVRVLDMSVVEDELLSRQQDPAWPTPVEARTYTKEGRPNQALELAVDMSELRLLGFLVEVTPNVQKVILRAGNRRNQVIPQDLLMKIFGGREFKDMLSKRSMAPRFQKLEHLDHQDGELHWLFWTLPELRSLSFNSRTRFRNDRMYVSNPTNLTKVVAVLPIDVLVQPNATITQELQSFFSGCQNLRSLTASFDLKNQWMYDGNTWSYAAFKQMLKACASTLEFLSIMYNHYHLPFDTRRGRSMLDSIRTLSELTALKELEISQRALLGSTGHLINLSVIDLFPQKIEQIRLLQLDECHLHWVEDLVRHRAHFAALKSITLCHGSVPKNGGVWDQRCGTNRMAVCIAGQRNRGL